MTTPDVNTSVRASVVHARARAPMGRRVVAHLLDVVITGAVALLFLGGISAVLGPTTTVAESATPPRVIVDPVRAVLESAGVTALSAVYFAGSWSMGGATLGQRLLRITVQDWRSRRLPTLRQSIARWVLLGGPLGLALTVALEQPIVFLVLLILTVAWTAVVLVTVLRHPMRRGLHDRASSSVVLVVAEAGPPDDLPER